MGEIEKYLVEKRKRKHMELPNWSFKIVVGILFYMFLIDTIVLILFWGTIAFTPEQWFIIPFTTLFEHWLAVILFFCCILIGWSVIEQKQ